MLGTVDYNNLPHLVGRNLKRELQEKGITQERFAEQIGVSDRTVRRWVGGDIHSLETVGEIANALQIRLEDILAEDVSFLFVGRKESFVVTQERTGLSCGGKQDTTCPVFRTNVRVEWPYCL